MSTMCLGRQFSNDRPSNTAATPRVEYTDNQKAQTNTPLCSLRHRRHVGVWCLLRHYKILVLLVLLVRSKQDVGEPEESTPVAQ